MLTGNIKSLNIPIHILEEGETAEGIKDSICYLITKNGAMLKKSNYLYTAISKVEGISGLADIKETAQVSFIKLKYDMLRKVMEFFRDTYEERKSEAVVLLYFSNAMNRWAVLVPTQDVNGASAKYDIKGKTIAMDDCGAIMESMPEGYRQMGSIHSHASMSAFHSGTDDKDEYGFDGLHITVGRLDEKNLEYAVRWIAAGQAIKSEIGQVVDIPEAVKKDRSPLMAMLKPKEEHRYQSCFVSPYSVSGGGGAEDDGIDSKQRKFRVNGRYACDDSTDMKDRESRKLMWDSPNDQDVLSAEEYGIVMHKF